MFLGSWTGGNGTTIKSNDDFASAELEVEDNEEPELEEDNTTSGLQQPDDGLYFFDEERTR